MDDPTYDPAEPDVIANAGFTLEQIQHMTMEEYAAVREELMRVSSKIGSLAP